MAEDIVDLLEAIDVEENDGTEQLGTARLDQRDLELLEEGAAVEETGERVGAGKPHKLGLALLAFDGVADGAEQRARLDLALLQVIAGTVLQGLAGALEIRQAGEHDDRHVGGGVAQGAQPVEA